jgi:RsiW-degrading membrane proteinase PrsW (M82 family)
MDDRSGPAIPVANYRYAEDLYARNLELQSDSLTTLSNGSLTALAALLAVGSLLFSYSQLKGHLPAGAFLWSSIALLLLAGGLLSGSWIVSIQLAESNPLHAGVDLLVRGVSEETVRASVVRQMVEVYASRRRSAAASGLLLGVALPAAAGAVSLFIYGTGVH